MDRLELSLGSPEENLALDEALLDWAEADGPQRELLRVWESGQPIVVVGRSSRVSEEVDEGACAARRIPILRRSSGGAAVVAGPGCLMYALVLSYQLRPELRDINRAHCFVLGRLADAIGHLLPGVCHCGTSDLALADVADQAGGRDTARPCDAPTTARKFSGNSLRAKRTHLLYHGTVLYDFDLSLVGQCLRMPARQPEYRQARPHAEFVTNVPLTRDAIRQTILGAWPTEAALTDWPRELVRQLIAERFSQDDWNFAFGREVARE